MKTFTSAASRLVPGRLGAALSIPFALAACTGGTSDTQPAASTPHVVRVVMSDSMRFSPTPITVAAGDTVEWVNAGAMPHTATDKPGAAGNPEHQALPAGAEAFDTGMLDAGQTAKVVLTTPGEYTYLCIFHEAGNMVGRITVR